MVAIAGTEPTAPCLTSIGKGSDWFSDEHEPASIHETPLARGPPEGLGAGRGPGPRVSQRLWQKLGYRR